MAVTTETWNINTEAVRDNLFQRIAQLPLGEYVGIIKNKKQSRSDAQHSLKWVWMGFLEKERSGNEGFTRKGWNWRLKERFIAPILMAQDPDFHDVFANYYRIRDLLCEHPEEFRRYRIQFWSDSIKTEDLYVAGMHEYMTMVDRYCLEKFNLVLPVRDDLFWAYERG